MAINSVKSQVLVRPRSERLVSTSLQRAMAVVLAGLLIAASMFVFIEPNSVRLKPAQQVVAGQVATLVGTYMEQWDPEKDPLVELPNGMQAKSSNVYGVEFLGNRYFYRPRHHASYDPVSMGKAPKPIVVAVLYQGTEWETEVYMVAK